MVHIKYSAYPFIWFVESERNIRHAGIDHAQSCQSTYKHKIFHQVTGNGRYSSKIQANGLIKKSNDWQAGSI